MNPQPPRVVPTLTEVLDEATWHAPAPAGHAGQTPTLPEVIAAVVPAEAAMPEADLAPVVLQDLAPPIEPVLARDFDLDLGAVVEIMAPAPEPVPTHATAAPTLPPDNNAFFEALELGLRQRLSVALDLLVDDLLRQGVRESLERATSRLSESLLADLRQQLAPQLEGLMQQALNEVLRQERDRLAR